uniref:Transformation/transcription domain-associated protein n=1 Tax=Kwoniella dejecticola CBS 10117 TaxID=1296121 RepID=A0A1A5ZVC5_9TREE|nr:transformation/transcription domain-associated protein [Kwoniella dejecticola CBS 10117]OBR81761.1 transformation/transcription domain-associated protein [Kwoniella dejecticola CBS 10117]
MSSSAPGPSTGRNTRPRKASTASSQAQAPAPAPTDTPSQPQAQAQAQTPAAAAPAAAPTTQPAVPPLPPPQAHAQSQTQTPAQAHSQAQLPPQGQAQTQSQPSLQPQPQASSQSQPLARPPAQPPSHSQNQTPTPSASAVGGGVSVQPPYSTGNGPSTVADCEYMVSQLLEPGLNPRRKLELAFELRDTAEQTREFSFYEKYLAIFIPALITILGDEKSVTFVKENSEQRLRHTLIAFLQRLPHNEPLRHHLNSIMDLCVKLLKIENEENALLCIKIMIDGLRSNKEQMEPYIEPFLDLVKQMYANTKAVVEKEFGPTGSLSATTPAPAPTPVAPKPPISAGPNPAAPSPNPATPASDNSAQAQPGPPQPPNPQHTILPHALHSPKVLTECPIAVVLIFQTYKQIMQTAMLDFYPLVIDSIKIQPEPQRLAHEEAQKKGEIFVGIADGIMNREMYAELIKAQVKTMAFLAYVLRGNQGNNKEYVDVFPEACLRLLRDCPPEDVGTRKELLVATRHILTVESRSCFIPYIDVLLEERVLVGTGVSSRELLRPLAYSVVADLIHHVRNDLPLSQLTQVVYVFSCNLNDSTFNSSIQTMCAKLLNTIIDSIHSKADSDEFARIVKGIFFTFLEKLTAMSEAHDRLRAIGLRDKGKGKEKEEADGDVRMEDEAKSNAEDRMQNGWRDIEQAMPVHSVAYANESLESFCRESRYLFKTLLHTFRTLLTYTRQGDNPAPQPDGELLSKFFEHSLKCLAIFDFMGRDPREPKEALELLSQILLLFEPHVFAEVWTSHMAFFSELATTNAQIFPILQMLITHESVSHQLVAILLKHLMNNLEGLGTMDKHQATLTLKMFKISFLAINTYIANNEVVLVPHLQKLIMSSFEYAAKSEDPSMYYQILRALFRSIGGGRFEALYKEVLPILQEMLDNLSYLLQHAADDGQRDLFVELTLTVPVRLTNLLPHLSYLMKPLVHALGAGPDLVSQGLRTLELCIDNLTAEFLDPTMGPVLRSLMAALHKLLKPIPANRNHANAALKILGKLGGRNRRFQEVDTVLEFELFADRLVAPISFDGSRHRLQLVPLISTASATLRDEAQVLREDGLQVLMYSALTIFQHDGPCPEGNATFQRVMTGLFLACGQPKIGDKALEFVRNLCRRAFALELGRTESTDPSAKSFPDHSKKRFLPLTNALSDCFVATLHDSKPSERPGLSDLLATIVTDFKDLAHSPTFAGKVDGSRSFERMVAFLAHRLVSLCHEEDWSKKMAGVTAMSAFVHKIDLSRKMIIDLELDFVRALLFCLRDAPKDTPKSSEEVIVLIKHLIDTCQSQEDGKPRLTRLVETLVAELNSQSPLARRASQECIEKLAEVTNQSVPDLITGVAKAKLLNTEHGPIYSKPLRALPFAMQVANINAVTYLMDLRPSVPDTSEEFTRLLHETLALADVDDANLISKPATHKQEDWLKKLRISCLKLLKSAMAAPDFLTKPNLTQLRARIIQVYFKHVYSTNPDIVDVAHEGLRDVLQQQNKLPKDVLQQGLRPILVNLADAKRLSVSGLDGLARFLELLTNYFKVEIGTKLLDHFKILGDENMLQQAAFSPLDDNPDISRMARLVNIFRLLPANAITYLNDLVAEVVRVEAILHQSVPGPFTENLGKYLNRYYQSGAQNLIDNIKDPRYIWTYRNIIASGCAPKLVEELATKSETLCQLCFGQPEDNDTVLPGLYLIRELSRVSATWLIDDNSAGEPALEPLVRVWRIIVSKSRDPKSDMTSYHYQQIPSLLLEMLMTSLKNQRHVALLFHVVEAYEVRASFERSHVSFFLYQQVALVDDLPHRKEIIEYFFDLYEQESVSWAFKTNALRVIINPTLRVHFSRPNADQSIISPQLVSKIGNLIWRPLAATAAAKHREDTHLIEIFALTTLLVHHCSAKVNEARKEIFKLAWMGINLLEPTVKLMAYVLAARFMATFETPVKFVRLTWTGVLRLKETDNRTLYRLAIDTLAASLAIRDPPPASGIPEWAKLLRTVLIEEGHATNQLVTVCELLVNHPDLFYDYRELYVPHVAHSLSKLAFVQAATPELKKLTVDIVELIFNWEKRRMAARDAENMAMDVDGSGPKRTGDHLTEQSPVKRQRVDRAGTAVSGSSGGGWAAPGQVRELMTAHLLRLVSTSSESVTRNGLTRRALDLFKEILGPKGLPNVHVKLGFFQRTMTQDINDNTRTTVANSTEVIAAAAAVRDSHWVRANLGLLSKLLEKVWVSDETELHEVVAPLTEDLFAEMPADENAESDPEPKALFAFVQNAVNEGLSSSLKSSSNLPGTLFVLRSWLKTHPKVLQSEAVSSALLKVLGSLVKVHTGNLNAPAQGNDPDPTAKLIISVLNIVRDRAGDLREQRKHLYSIITTLVERSLSTALCRYVLHLIRHWVIEDNEGAAHGKEKAGIILRMPVFEQRDDALFQEYLDVIYEIYEDDRLRGTDITHRLEPAFLLGTKSKNAVQRTKFLDKLEQSLPRSLDGRLQYLYSLQNWDTLADCYWIPQILSQILGIADHEQRLVRKPSTTLLESDPIMDMAQKATVSDIVSPARNLIHLDDHLADKLWIDIFPMCWSSLTRAQQTAFTPYIVKLLSKEYLRKQVEMRPNVVQTFLDGILACKPPVTLPPLLVKYLAKTYNAWYAGFEILTRLTDIYRADDGLRESCANALSELYAELCEEDMFYGLARSRCVFPETTAALTYEQNGLWPKAIELYEQAQIKARTHLLPFTEEEYCFWEDHWILSAQKLQNWENLTELARVDQDADLLLECAWRLSDWTSPDRDMIDQNIARIADIPTPRRKTFEAFTSLLRSHLAREPPNEFSRVLDEAQQVTLRKWVSLPTNITNAHLPLLQMFQQCVELTEAAQVFDSLQMTNQQNLEMRCNSDLKTIFTTWRDRLPNFWDDISVWSDLLAWRQHVFQAVTRVYHPLIPPGDTATYGYRGFHETAWMINRFGEVARRHGLLDVCSVSLNKIYMLPNIEISEAFLKLREQALCFFQKPDKFNDGLDNISTTNLMYFAPPQKAEFLTLKGMFISRLGQNEEANAEFAHAIQMDMNLPKAWAEWGRFNDKLYRDRPENNYANDRAILASSAVSCYLQAAGLYNNHKSRGLLLRVLWLLGLDDSRNTISKAFENYKGDLVIWYWITLIPQLLMSLSHREAKQARLLLLRIAKQFPQALFFHLRVSREDFVGVKKQQMQSRAAAQRRADAQAKAAAANAAAAAEAAAESRPTEENKEGVKSEQQQPNGDSDTPTANGNQPSGPQQANGGPNGVANGNGQMAPPAQLPPPPRQPWDHVDEIMNMLKTAFPLLALTMEKMVDQISLRAKPNPDEDIYRFFSALLADAMQQWGGRGGLPNDDGELNAQTKDNLAKFATNLNGDLKASIEKDFMKDMPKLREYIKRLQQWRDYYEKNLDARPKVQPLDQGGCNLTEFHHTKFDDVEIPGQYVHHVDQGEEFIKIARFAPKAELGRGHGHCFRRITMIGNNGTSYTFHVQMPAARHCRREERLTQLFRIMNSVLKKRKESRRRNLQFHLPTATPLAPQLRLVQADSSYVSLQDIFEDFSASKGMSREDTTLAYFDRIKQLHDPAIPRNDPRFSQLKAEVMEEIQTKMVPENIMTNYMIRTMDNPESLWLMRKQFALQTATTMFLTYVCCLSNRTPSRFYISRKTGLMYMTEILPAFAPGQPLIASQEQVPFRLTPNMQNFITRIGIEGVVTAACTAIARCLTQPEFDLSGTLCLFVRDELLIWHNTYMKDARQDSPLINHVYKNVDNFIRRAGTMGYIGENKDKAPNASPAVHAIVTLISQATAPLNLAQMNETYMAWF